MKLKLSAIIVFAGILFLFPAAAYANSSWHWLTTSPLTLLPFAILFTLLIETCTVVKFAKVAFTKKTFLIICLANLLSFLAPYLERAWRFIPTSGFSLTAAFSKGPYYIIIAGYLILTIIVELPVVYFLLKKDAREKKKLLASILFSNIVTTAFMAVLERLICVGRW